MGRLIIAIAGGKAAFTSRKLKQRVPHSRRKQGLSRQERRDIADPGRSRGRVTVLPSLILIDAPAVRETLQVAQEYGRIVTRESLKHAMRQGTAPGEADV